jgi:hypothetical protein
VQAEIGARHLEQRTVFKKQGHNAGDLLLVEQAALNLSFVVLGKGLPKPLKSLF